MSQQLVNVGNPDDGTGDPGRTAFIKVNENTTELYTTRAQVKYTAVTSSGVDILDTDLILGQNIYGVNYSGIVNISLPANIDSNKLVIINDESGNASTNNITITVGIPALVPPENVDVDSFTDTTATISFDASVKGSAVSYAVYVNFNPFDIFIWDTLSPYLATGLTPDTSYTIYMITLDAESNASIPSNHVTFTTLP
jgi:hypothetical protein